MVYTGRPSKACQPCRDKRRKCDLKTPQCSSCIRMKVACFGYRNTRRLEVRDETDNVVRKAQDVKVRHGHRDRHQLAKVGAGRPCVCAKAADVDHEASPLIEPEGTYPAKERMPLSLTARPEQVALGHFLFVFSLTSPFCYLPEHLPGLVGDQAIMQALYAPALAAMSLQYRSDRLMREARSHYAKALSQMNKDLCDPHLAVLDKTLLCVLLLTTFEGLAFSGRSSPRNWQMHVRGLTKLLDMRMSARLETELSRHLVHHAAMTILTCCTIQHIPVPEAFWRLKEQVDQFRESEDVEHSTVNIHRRRIMQILMRLTTMRANMNGMLATEVVTECVSLDGEAACLLDEAYKRMPFQVFPVKPESDEFRQVTRGIAVCAYKEVLHTYDSPMAARMFNNIRLMRIVLNEWIFCAFDPSLRGVILDEPTPGDELYEIWDQIREQAVDRAAKLIDALLASVPYSLELLEPPFGTTARSLLWPLATTAGSEVCPRSAKVYIIGRLKALALLHDLDQAMEAATMLEEDIPLEDWIHLLHLS